MARAGTRRTNKYSDRFKATAVRLSELPEVLIQDVAAALDIHPFMLSRWRKQAREGELMTGGVKPDVELAAELKRRRELERRYKVLKREPDTIETALRSSVRWRASTASLAWAASVRSLNRRRCAAKPVALGREPRIAAEL